MKSRSAPLSRWLKATYGMSGNRKMRPMKDWSRSTMSGKPPPAAIVIISV